MPAHLLRNAVGGGARKTARSRHPHDFSIPTLSLSPRFRGQTQHPLRTRPRSCDVLDYRRRQRNPSQISTRDLRRTRRNGRGAGQRMPQAESKPSGRIASTSASNSASGMAPRMFRLLSSHRAAHDAARCFNLKPRHSPCKPPSSPLPRQSEFPHIR